MTGLKDRGRECHGRNRARSVLIRFLWAWSAAASHDWSCVADTHFAQDVIVVVEQDTVQLDTVDTRWPGDLLQQGVLEPSVCRLVVLCLTGYANASESQEIEQAHIKGDDVSGKPQFRHEISRALELDVVKVFPKLPRSFVLILLRGELPQISLRAPRHRDQEAEVPKDGPGLVALRRAFRDVANAVGSKDTVDRCRPLTRCQPNQALEL